MAKKTDITPVQAYEVPRVTAASTAFATLLTDVRNLIVAERDLANVNYSMDPAYGNWMREAELAHERLTGTLRAFESIRIEALEDRPLKLMANLVDAMLGHEEPGGAWRLLRDLHIVFFASFQLPGIGATALHRNAQLLHARSLVTALVALPLFDFIPDDAVGPDDDALTDGLPCDLVSAL